MMHLNVMRDKLELCSQNSCRFCPAQICGQRVHLLGREGARAAHGNLGQPRQEYEHAAPCAQVILCSSQRPLLLFHLAHRHRLGQDCNRSFLGYCMQAEDADRLFKEMISRHAEARVYLVCWHDHLFESPVWPHRIMPSWTRDDSHTRNCRQGCAHCGSVWPGLKLRCTESNEEGGSFCSPLPLFT